MIKPIVKDPLFLSRKASPATIMDIPVAKDLEDTIMAHADSCVGMAANMIGVCKNIIIYDNGKTFSVMFNPVITKKSMPYETEEGCLSLSGVRATTRYRKITVRYQDASFKWREGTFSDHTAQIIQHEIDHTNGIII